MSVTNERIPLLPDVPTAAEVYPDLGFSTWNGLFVHKDTPQDVRDVIAGVAQDVLSSDAAKKVAEETGAEIYWLGFDESNAQMEKDAATMERIAGFLEE